MKEPTFTELINKFNIISNALSVDEYIRPKLKILMRMNWDKSESVFYTEFGYVEVKRGGILESTYGNGATPEEAMRDYYKKIVGKRLVFHAMNPDYRRECVVV